MKPLELVCGDAGVEVFKGTKIITQGWHGIVGPSSGCAPVELPPLPGTYRVWIAETRSRWWVECERSGNTTVRTLKEETPRVQEQEYTFEVVMSEAAPAKPESGAVRIVEPVEGDQFAFDDTHPTGELVFAVLAKYSGDNGSVSFSTDGLGDSEIRIVPDSDSPPGTARATVIIRGLPPANGDFGAFTVRAEGDVAGSDAVRIELFYDPAASNHPGHGNPVYSGVPNWFYYWSQTGAGQPFNYRYKPRLRACSGSGIVQGRYVHETDTLYLSDAVLTEPCARRVAGAPDAGKQATGIDCFAEIVRHENVHRTEYAAWWEPLGVRLPECGLDDVTGSLYRMISGLDSDLDLVPDEVERRLADRGCDPQAKRSCLGRPHPALLDVEMNAYTEAWRQWRIGDADHEDWSRCGKQWRDRSVCPPGP